MKFVCVVFELGDKMLILSSMENLIVPCNHENIADKKQLIRNPYNNFSMIFLMMAGN